MKTRREVLLVALGRNRDCLGWDDTSTDGFTERTGQTLGGDVSCFHGETGSASHRRGALGDVHGSVAAKQCQTRVSVYLVQLDRLNSVRVFPCADGTLGCDLRDPKILKAWTSRNWCQDWSVSWSRDRCTRCVRRTNTNRRELG